MTEMLSQVRAASVRRATRGDAKMLSEFSQRTFLDAFEAQNEPDNIRQFVNESFSVARNESELDAANATTWLQYMGDVLSGFARMRTGPPPECVDAQSVIELQRLYVDKRLGIPGLGGQLLEFVVDRVREQGRRILWLGVWERNEAAQRFYRRYGFAAVGEQAFMLGADKQRDIVMTLDLGG